VVDALQDTGVLQPGIHFPGGNRTPSDRTSTSVGNYPYVLTLLHQPLERLFVPRSLPVLELLPPQPPGHAPASPARPAVPEKFFEISPGALLEGTIFQWGPIDCRSIRAGARSDRMRLNIRRLSDRKSVV